MAIRDVHYLPGRAVCVAGPGVALITDLGAGSSVVTACWAALAAGRDADALAEIVRREVPTGAARVALAGHAGIGVRILLGGDGARALLTPPDVGPVELRATAGSWVDERYPTATPVRLAVAPDGADAIGDDAPLPIGAGVALASAVLLGSVETETHGDGDWLAPEAFGVDLDTEVEEPVPIAEPPGVAPTVLAVSCPNGHLGPPYDDTCRVCAAPIPPQGTFSAPRPPLGSLALSSGATVPLDRDVVFGRAPSCGAAAPDHGGVRLVPVPSPNNDVSRNHARVSLDGWHVLVTDLGSTNGTIVRAPGGQPVQLQPHDAVPITPGTVVALADEIEIRYDPRA